MPDVKLAVPMSTAEGGPGVQQIVIAPPRNFVRQQSSRLQEAAAQNPMKSLVMNMLLTSLLTALVPLIIVFYVYYANEGAPCDRPIGNWLWWSGAIAVLQLAFSLPQQIWQIRNLSNTNVPAGVEGLAALNANQPPIFVVLQAAMCPVAVFGFYWYIKGNIDVWSSEECDGALLNGAQAYLTFTYVMLGITLLLCCCMCCGMMLVGVFVASAEQASQQRSRVATEEPRVTELH